MNVCIGLAKSQELVGLDHGAGESSAHLTTQQMCSPEYGAKIGLLAIASCQQVHVELSALCQSLAGEVVSPSQC